MSDLVFVCRHCAKKLVIDESGVGATISCPDCAKMNSVPQPEMRCQCPACKTKYGATADMRGESMDCPNCDSSFVIHALSARDSKPSERVCIECGAALHSDAAFCVKCGVNQQTGLKLKSVDRQREPRSGHTVSGVEQSVNPVLERLARPQRRQPGLVERCLPAIKAVALVSCIAACAMVVWHYSRQWSSSKAFVPAPAASAGVPAAEASAVAADGAAAAPVVVAQAALTFPDPVRAVPPRVQEVIDVLDGLKANPADRAAGGRLIAYIGSIAETNETRSIVAGLKALHGLREVGLGRTEGGLAICAGVQRDYADTDFTPLLLRDQLLESCGKCAGRREVQQPCSVCSKDGVCPSCGGRGSRQVAKSAPLAGATPMPRGGVRRIQDAPAKVIITTGCSACQGSGRCTACNGTGHLSIACQDCRQSGMVVSRSNVRRQYDVVISNTVLQLTKFAEQGHDLVLTANREQAGFMSSPVERPERQEPEIQQRPLGARQPENNITIHYVSQLVKLVDETFVPLTSPAPEGTSLTDLMHECSLKTGDEEKIAAASVKLCQHLRDVRRERERRVQQYQGTDKKNYPGLAPSRTYSRRCSHWGGYYGLCDACRLHLEQQQAEQKKAEEQASERKNFYLTAIVNNWNTYESAERARCDRELEAIRAMEVALRKGLAAPSGADAMASQP